MVLKAALKSVESTHFSLSRLLLAQSLGWFNAHMSLPVENSYFAVRCYFSSLFHPNRVAIVSIIRLFFVAKWYSKFSLLRNNAFTQTTQSLRISFSLEGGAIWPETNNYS